MLIRILSQTLSSSGGSTSRLFLLSVLLILLSTLQMFRYVDTYLEYLEAEHSCSVIPSKGLCLVRGERVAGGSR